MAKRSNYLRDFDPKRPADWRYQLALDSVDGEVSSARRRLMDAPVKRLRSYIMAKRRATNLYEREQDLRAALGERFGPVWLAEDIYSDRRDNRTRYTLEAMILARYTDEEIAKHFTVDADTVRIYEACFFNVRDRIDSRRYIGNVVLPPVFMSGINNRTTELACKYFGYYGGKEILSLIMDGTDTHKTVPSDPFQVKQWLSDQFNARFRMVAVVGATFMEPSNYNIRTLLEGFNQLLSLDQRIQGETGDDNAIARSVEQFVRAFEAPLGSDFDKVSGLPTAPYAGGAIEPRVDEIRRLSLGEEVPELEEYNSEDYETPFSNVIDAQNVTSNSPTDSG